MQREGKALKALYPRDDILLAVSQKFAVAVNQESDLKAAQKESQDMANVLNARLSEREYHCRYLEEIITKQREEFREAKERIKELEQENRALNAEIKGLLRQNQPSRGIFGYIVERITHK
jgi:DNA anti-recombination protein RmuC